MKKLSPKIKLGCSKCGNSLELDTIDFNFNFKFENKVTTITGRNNNNKKSSKVISLF